MKQTLTLFTAISIASIATAQSSITVKNEGGEVVNGLSFTVNGSADAPDMGVALSVTFGGAGTGQINVKRYEMDVLAATQNYFCWYECYAPLTAGESPEFIAPEPVPMDNGETFEGFHAYYRPLGVSGTSCFRYVWYTVNNVNDSAWADICFAAAPVGISEHSARAYRLDAAPNPSAGEVTFQFEGSGQRRILSLHNALGELVSSTAIQGTQRKLTLSEGTLPSGVWFASLEVDGRVVASRRFVISGH